MLTLTSSGIAKNSKEYMLGSTIATVRVASQTVDVAAVGHFSSSEVTFVSGRVGIGVGFTFAFQYSRYQLRVPKD